jgi:translation initiation factor 1A
MGKREEEEAREQQESEISRIRLPRPPQTFGLVSRLVGGSRMEVKCFDGKGRICRIPGRLKRRLWIRPNDLVIVEPWEYCGNEKGDILYKYTKTQLGWLRNKGYLKKLEEFEEF